LQQSPPFLKGANKSSTLPNKAGVRSSGRKPSKKTKVSSQGDKKTLRVFENQKITFEAQEKAVSDFLEPVWNQSTHFEEEQATQT
jgi:translation initiation factor 2 beta subunit (eIF-2beta)/eIF-5